MSNETLPQIDLKAEKSAEQVLAENQEIGAKTIKAAEEHIVERRLPDGTMFKGTMEQYKQELEDYRDRIGA